VRVVIKRVDGFGYGIDTEEQLVGEQGVEVGHREASGRVDADNLAKKGTLSTAQEYLRPSTCINSRVH
jgi:hypothetical protein